MSFGLFGDHCRVKRSRREEGALLAVTLRACLPEQLFSLGRLIVTAVGRPVDGTGVIAGSRSRRRCDVGGGGPVWNGREGHGDVQQVHVSEARYLQWPGVLAALQYREHQLQHSRQVGVIDDLAADIRPGPRHARRQGVQVFADAIFQSRDQLVAGERLQQGRRAGGPDEQLKSRLCACGKTAGRAARCMGTESMAPAAP